MSTLSYRLVSVLLLLALSNCSWAPAAQGADTAAPRYVFDKDWPKKPPGHKWTPVPSLSMDSKDNIYLFTRNEPTVQVYRPDGTFVRGFNTENQLGAHRIQIGPKGNVWITDCARQVVEKYSPEGKRLLTLGEPDVVGDDESHFKGPTGMAVIPSGDIFVSDGYGNSRIVHFDKNGKFVKQWGSKGKEPGQFDVVHAIVADSKNRLYVADRANQRIQVFDTDGKVLDVWDNLLAPWGFHITEKDELWVCGASIVKEKQGDQPKDLPPPDQLVMKLNSDGKVLVRVSLPKTENPSAKPGEVNQIHGIAVDSQGNLYLGGILAYPPRKFSPRTQ